MNTTFRLYVLAVAFCLVRPLTSAHASETKVTLGQVPVSVKTAIAQAVGDGKLVDIGKIEKLGVTTYEIEIRRAGKEIDVLFDSSGKEIDRTIEGNAEKAEINDDERKEGAKKSRMRTKLTMKMMMTMKITKQAKKVLASNTRLTSSIANF